MPMQSDTLPSGTRARGREHVHPALAAAHARFHVPSAFEVDGWVYLTGVIAARAPDDAQDDFEPAFERAFTQIAEVLALAGCNWGDVVKITSHHLDIGAEIGAMAKVKDRHVAAPYPAWSVIGAGSLANPAGVCEIEVIARKAQ
jgi:enamine deaminase RidA (YjgF/YER057c/UK114 family)